MGSAVIGYIFALIKSLVTKKVVEEFALLAIKEIAKYTENDIDDKAVEIIERGLGRK